MHSTIGYVSIDRKFGVCFRPRAAGAGQAGRRAVTVGRAPRDGRTSIAGRRNGGGTPRSVTNMHAGSRGRHPVQRRSQSMTTFSRASDVSDTRWRGGVDWQCRSGATTS